MGVVSVAEGGWGVGAFLWRGLWVGRSRRLGLERAAKLAGARAECQAENVVLRDTVEFLTERLACAERRLKAASIRKPYSLAERLHILWAIEYFGVARSTVRRWLHRLQDGVVRKESSAPLGHARGLVRLSRR